MKNENELITVTCPECGKKRFSFSLNAIDGKNTGIRFDCTECGSTVRICREYNTDTKNFDGDIFVSCS